MSPAVASRFYHASIGKKAVMAVTGVVLFGFIVGHLIGNLQVFEGRAKLDNYSAFLKGVPALLWGTRTLLLVCVVLHIVASIQLARLNQRARPIAYLRKDNSHSSYASRTMMWSGPIIAAFVIYHLLDFTFGAVNPGFREGRVYDNLIHGFQRVPIAVAYIFAIVLLCVHLKHGLYSMFQSLGFTHHAVKRVAGIASFLIAAGYSSIPLAVMAGILHT